MDHMKSTEQVSCAEEKHSLANFLLLWFQDTHLLVY